MSRYEHIFRPFGFFVAIVGAFLILFGGFCVSLGLPALKDSSGTFDFIFEWGLVGMASGVILIFAALWLRARRSSPPNEEPEADRETPSTGGGSEDGEAGS